MVYLIIAFFSTFKPLISPFVFTDSAEAFDEIYSASAAYF